MFSKVSARFYVSEITHYGNSDQSRVTLLPAYGDGQNADWAKYTPSGKVELNITAGTSAESFFRDLLRDKAHNIAIEFSVVDKGE